MTDPTPTPTSIRCLNSAHGKDWTMYHGDCVEVIRQIPDNSVDLQLFSPPFANVYTYSDSPRDMGNCDNEREFMEHYRFLAGELYRTLRPGRLCVIHCKDLIRYRGAHGRAGMHDLPGDLVRVLPSVVALPPLPGSLPGRLLRDSTADLGNIMHSTIGAPWVGAPWTPRAWQKDALPIIIDALKRRQRGIVSAVMGSGKSIMQSELVALALAKAGHRSIVVTVPRQALVRQLAATIGARIGEDRVGVFYGRTKQPGRDVIVCCNASLPRLWEELQSYPKGVALMICDEAHGTQGEVLRETIPQINPAALVGFTATPFRSVPSETIEIFDSVIYRYTMTDAMRDGVLVPMRHERVRGEAEGSIDEVCLAMMQEHGAGPGIVSATSIDDADAYAAWLTDRDFPAASIHSGHSEADRIARLDDLRAGRVRALVHVSLLAEGVDFPWLRWLCLRRNVQARVRFLQEIGRVLRVDNDPDPDSARRPKAWCSTPIYFLGVTVW
jgi:hypothetical protein